MACRHNGNENRNKLATFYINMLELIEMKDFEALTYFITIRASIILLCCLFMIAANMVDFWSGTTTAKAIGKAIMSHRFRRTITKIGDYVRLMLFALMFDILGSLLSFYIIPFATIICTIAVIFIEGKSVIENSRRKKAHAADVPDIVKQIVQAATTKQGTEILQKIIENISLEKKDEKN